MNEDVIKLIKSIATDVFIDDSLVAFLLRTEEQHILNFCNLTELPQELANDLVERVAGRYLQIRKADILGDNSDVVTSIKEGDVTVNFNAESPSTRLQSIIDYLTRERDLLSFRKLKW